jgi:hypothetical protein
MASVKRKLVAGWILGCVIGWTSIALGQQLLYHGGPVVSNPEIVMVRYELDLPDSNFEPFLLDSAAKRSMKSFLAGRRYKPFRLSWLA